MFELEMFELEMLELECLNWKRLNWKCLNWKSWNTNRNIFFLQAYTISLSRIYHPVWHLKFRKISNSNISNL